MIVLNGAFFGRLMYYRGFWGLVDRCGKLTIEIEGMVSKSNDQNVWYRISDNPKVIVGHGSGSVKCVVRMLGHERIVVIFNGRLDNRGDLLLMLKCSADSSDAELAASAYCHWGEESVNKLYGDWSFAVWSDRENKLFLARDHFGVTSVYYSERDGAILFSSSKEFILNNSFISMDLDEVYIAQVLSAWAVYHGENTAHKALKRLPPGHFLTNTPTGTLQRRYWFPAKIKPLIYRRKSDYVEAFLDVYTEAVRSRIPETGMIAVSLSGGLDSGSVAAILSKLLSSTQRRITAYTSVPIDETSNFIRYGTGNELSYASATANHLQNVDLIPVTHIPWSPVTTIRKVLGITKEPLFSASNQYWMMAIRQMVGSTGGKVLFSGQTGNATVSWHGSIFSQPLSYVFAKAGITGIVKHALGKHLPHFVLKQYNSVRHYNDAWLKHIGINPEFARKVELVKMRLDEHDRGSTPIESRCRLLPESSMIGCSQTEIGAAFGLEVRDPTADARVIEFTFSVPDQIFIDHATDTDRWLIRESMKDKLPEMVRLSTCYGRQASDRVLRLRATSNEVESVLKEISLGPAANFVCIDSLRSMWNAIQKEDSPGSLGTSALFLRAVMSGLFVNNFYADNKFRADDYDDCQGSDH